MHPAAQPTATRLSPSVRCPRYPAPVPAEYRLVRCPEPADHLMLSAFPPGYPDAASVSAAPVAGHAADSPLPDGRKPPQTGSAPTHSAAGYAAAHSLPAISHSGRSIPPDGHVPFS